MDIHGLCKIQSISHGWTHTYKSIQKSLNVPQSSWIYPVHGWKDEFGTLNMEMFQRGAGRKGCEWEDWKSVCMLGVCTYPFCRYTVDKASLSMELGRASGIT
jgi:hypothetical protein